MIYNIYKWEDIHQQESILDQLDFTIELHLE